MLLRLVNYTRLVFKFWGTGHPEGFDRVESEIPREAMLAYHETNGKHWKALAKYVTEDYR